jgi:uncharacterized protein YwqG
MTLPPPYDAFSHAAGAPALHVTATRTNSPQGEHGSHWGGVPKVPAGWAWPMKGDTPLDFLACLDVAQVQAAQAYDWLPEAGTLLFFYDTQEQPWGFDPNDRGGWHVEYIAPATPVALVEGRGKVYEYRTMGFRPIETHEDGYPQDLRDAQGQDVDDEDVIDSVYAAVSTQNYGVAPHHQIGGFPHAIQNPDMARECELASQGVNVGSSEGYCSPQGQALMAGEGENDWRLLLQIDTDDEDTDGWMWGDSGILYFWVRQQQARAGLFDQAWVVLQCC